MRWLPFFLKRLIWLVPTLFALLTLVFVMARMMPVDPAILLAGEASSPEQVQHVRERLNLDEPLDSQYWNYLVAVLNGNLGESLYTLRPVAVDIMERLPATIELTIASLFVAAIVGVPLGVVCGVHGDTWLDHLLRIIVVGCAGLTHFWIGIQFQIFFAMELNWLPLSGRIDVEPPRNVTGLYIIDSIASGNLDALVSAVRHLTLPALTIGLHAAAIVQGITRNSVLSMIGSPSVRYLQAMGLSPTLLNWKYLLRSSLAATVTWFGLAAGMLLAGVVVVETIFDWPGTGNYAVGSIMYADYNAVVGFTLLAGALFVLINILVETAQVIIDPRGAT